MTDMNMDLKGQKTLVVGLGRTGEAVCSFLADRGALVTVSEKRPASQLGDQITSLEAKGVRVEAGSHGRETFLNADLIVTSPGVPPLALFSEAESRGVPVISEIELAYHFLKGTIVGITGSNGKSTTTTLIHTLLADAGVPSHLAGNIGTPLITYVQNSTEEDIFVTELSSFQLEHIRSFKADTAVFLNISPDHLDWHRSMDSYIAAKTRLISGMDQSGTVVLNRDDPQVWKRRTETAAQLLPFSRSKEPDSVCYIEDGWIVLAAETPARLMPLEDIPLLGPHNQENVMAAALAAGRFGLEPEEMAATVRRFRGLEHRLEKAAEIGGVFFYNDSKATNVDSTLRAIDSFNSPILLILGGRDKDGDFTKLRGAVKTKVKAVFLIGEAKEKIAGALDGYAPLFTVNDLGEAVRQGYEKAQPGEIVLLAPACTSWDMYRSFEERGRHFKREAAALKKTRDGQ